MQTYAESYWSNWNWYEFEGIVWELFHNRYFEQPRLTGGFQYTGKRGLWLPISLTYTRHLISHSSVLTTASGICLCPNELVPHIDFSDGDRWARAVDETYGVCEPEKRSYLNNLQFEQDMKDLEDSGVLQVVSLP